jgi:hypothetical protein
LNHIMVSMSPPEEHAMPIGRIAGEWAQPLRAPSRPLAPPRGPSRPLAVQQ